MRSLSYRQFRCGDEKSIVRLWNAEMQRLGYQPIKNVSAFRDRYIKNPSFDPKGCMLAFCGEELAGCVLAVCQAEYLPGQSSLHTPGYLSALFVGQKYQSVGIGSELLGRAEAYLMAQGKSEFVWSHKSPVKLPWYVNQDKAEHNKAPGIKIDSYGYRFLLKNGYQTVQEEVSYYRPLKDFYLLPEIMEQQGRLEEREIVIAYFEAGKHYGFQGMFDRLRDESFRKKFLDGLAHGDKILIAAEKQGRVCATAGVIRREESGRGSFSALAVDPRFGGMKIGNVLFNNLCTELQKQGAEYMTLFVTKTNFAKIIYEKAGFTPVQTWAIMKKIKGEKGNGVGFKQIDNGE